MEQIIYDANISAFRAISRNLVLKNYMDYLDKKGLNVKKSFM